MIFSLLKKVAKKDKKPSINDMKLHPSTLTFLASIREHNSREFFALVRPLYDEIHTQLKQVCQECIKEASKIDNNLEGLQPKDCMFRIYRDARRLKKWDYIYKNNRGFVMSPGGKNSSLPWYYVHIQWWNKSFFWWGVYWPESQQLRNLREYFALHGDEYKKILKSSAFKKNFSTPTGEKATRPPRGFSIDTPHIDLIMRKQHMIYKPLSDKEIINGDFVDIITNYVEVAYPRMHFLYKWATFEDHAHNTQSKKKKAIKYDDE